MKNIIGILIGIILIIFIASINKSKTQITKTYKTPDIYMDMKKDIDFYYSQGYRVVAISSFGESYKSSQAILVMEK